MNGIPIIRGINNNVLNFKNAIPLKNTTTNNEQSFEIDRKLFNKAFQPNINFSSLQTGGSVIQRESPAIQHGFVVDGPKSALQKKWIGGNRDASQTVLRRRMNTTGQAIQKSGPVSFNSGNDNNSRIDALARVRGSGSRVPLKVTNRPTIALTADISKYYRIVSAGLAAISGTLVNISGFSANGISPGFYSYTTTNLVGTPLAMASSSTFVRSYNVLTIDRNTGATTVTNYDVFGGTGATPLTNYLNSLTSSVIVIIATYDEPKTSGSGTPIPAGLIAAVKRCGGSSSFGSAPSGFINYRGAYVLLGIPDIGTGNGIERYVGNTTGSGDPNAAIDLRFAVSNGLYSYISG